MDFMTFLLLLIIIIGLISIVYIIVYSNLQVYTLKINEAEGIIDDLLRKKYDLILLMKDVIFEETDLNKKTFDEVIKLKKLNLSSFDFERKLTEFNNLIIKINGDYDVLLSNIRFNNYLNDLNEINQKLEAAKSFYNKYTNLLNNYTKKFPSNLIAFFHHINTRNFFDGKDMFDDDIKDFKL